MSSVTARVTAGLDETRGGRTPTGSPEGQGCETRRFLHPFTETEGKVRSVRVVPVELGVSYSVSIESGFCGRKVSTVLFVRRDNPETTLTRGDLHCEDRSRVGHVDMYFHEWEWRVTVVMSSNSSKITSRSPPSPSPVDVEGWSGWSPLPGEGRRTGSPRGT